MNYFLDSETRLNLIEKLEKHTGMPTKMAVPVSEYPDDLDKLDALLALHSHSAAKWAKDLINAKLAGNTQTIRECVAFIAADVTIMTAYMEEAQDRGIPELRFKKWSEANRLNAQRVTKLHDEMKAITKH